MSTSVADDAADLFQEHRDELGFVNRAQCREGDLITERRDGRVVGALLGNHCVRKPQSTVYELAVKPEYRRDGIGSSLVRQFAKESPHEKLVAKCPVTLSATEYYDATGWTRVDTEDGKNRALAVFEYPVDDSPDLITTGREDLIQLAANYGWLTGSRLDTISENEKHGIPINFIDLHWDDPDVDHLFEAAKKHRPQYAIAGDYADDGNDIGAINDRAKQLRQYAERVIVVPHGPGQVEQVPEWAVVGYSTPTKYAGTDAPIWEYQGRDVHILGGNIEQILELHGYLCDDIVSIDTNSHHRGATSFAKWWGQSTPSWNKVPTAVPRPDNAEKAYKNSMLNINYAMRQHGIITPNTHTEADA